MRKSASEVIRNLESRIARLEKEAYGYKVETEGREEGGFIPRDNRKNKMEATSLFDRLLGRTFNKQVERALKSEGAKSISVSFEPSSRIVGEFTNPYAKHNNDEPSSWPLKAEGEGKMFFMLEGSPYEFPFILVGDRIYLGYKDGLNGRAGSVQTTDDGKVSKVVMGRNFLSAIEWANEKFYGKRFARLEKSSGRFDLKSASTRKYARSIPRPPRNTMTELLTVDRATKISDKALDVEYGYGLSKPGSFGYEANKYSSMYALGAIAENMKLVATNPDNAKLIEIVADAVHDGWSYAAYNVDDPRYQTQPEKRANRIELADAPYRSLSEGEKEKDRVIARALINTVYMAYKR